MWALSTSCRQRLQFAICTPAGVKSAAMVDARPVHAANPQGLEFEDGDRAQFSDPRQGSWAPPPVTLCGLTKRDGKIAARGAQVMVHLTCSVCGHEELGPKDDERQWERQHQTHYELLSDREKGSDRKEARITIAAINAWLSGEPEPRE